MIKMRQHPSYQYAERVIAGREEAPRYVKKQCQVFLDVCDGKDERYFIDTKRVEKISKILKLLKMPKGLRVNERIYDCIAGFQWLLIIASLCVMHTSNPEKRRYETVLLEIARKNGKAVSLDTLIPTPSGWKTMGDIVVGDYVFGADGKPTKVVYESDIFTDKDMYLIEFEDGEKVKASCDHIWRVKTKTSKRTASRKCNKIGKGKIYQEGGWYDTFTSDMVDDFVRARKDGKGNEYKYRVPMNKAVEYQEQELPINPYLLGVWLGDGGSVNNDITVSDADMMETFHNLENLGYKNEIVKHKDRSSSIRIDIEHMGNHADKNSFRWKLKELGVFSNKHIPEIYKQASIEQRLALLQGLMDTDGTCSKAGECEFVQKSDILAEDMLDILHSLGIKAKNYKKTSICNGKEAGLVNRITFFTDKTMPCFRMERKKERLKETLSDRMKAKTIVNITKIEKEPCKCIMVDNKEHLYLCGRNYTVTHNTFIIAVLFILLFFLEPRYSYFYSVAPDGSLSREIKKAIEEIIGFNPKILVQEGKDRMFKLRRDDIECYITNSKYIPLNYSNSRLDGKLPNVFLVDETGALPNSYAIEAMRSGQLTILNKLGFIISTKYPTANNPFEDEVLYCKKVLDGHITDEKVFALLYEPDDPMNWTSDDKILAHANPLALEIEDIWNDLLDKRQRAIEVESARENFLTKHCNIIYQGKGTETYIDINKVKACEVDNIDWQGRQVWLGVDLAQTNDNCSVAMAGVDDDNNILADVIAFIPDGRIDEKNKFEHIDYRRFIEQMKCIACGDMVVDYSVIEDFVLGIEEKYGVQVVAIGYDRYNAMSSAQKWNKKYTTVEIRQHSDTLHPPTKLLSEKVESGEFKYVKNTLLEINFENAKCTYDTNMNRYVNKKKSSGKVDMVVALINAIYLVQQDIIFGDRDFIVQVI